MAGRVTITEVAKAAGVSKTAVSFAFNSPGKLGESTLERVLRVAHDLGYTPHPAARWLSTRRSGAIGLLVPQPLDTVFANAFLAELIQGIGEPCERHDLSLLLVPPLNGSLEGAVRQAAVDGFLSLGLRPDDHAIQTLSRLGLPVVSVDFDGGPHLVAVNVDDAGGAAAAARHLLKLGHRELAVVMLGPAYPERLPLGVTERRLAGYQHAIEEAGARPPITVAAGATTEAGARAFRTLWKRARKPTGILAMSDMAAIGVMSAAKAAGLRVPEDLSVVGFDDLAIAAWTNPALTTVRQPIVLKGRLAASLLISIIQGSTPTSPAPLETRLVIRKTTAKPKGVVNRRA